MFSFLQGQSLINQKVSPPSDKSGNQSPIESFILLEKFNAIKLVQSVHGTLAALSKVIRGTQLLTKEVAALAEALMNQEVGWSCIPSCDCMIELLYSKFHMFLRNRIESTSLLIENVNVCSKEYFDIEK